MQNVQLRAQVTFARDGQIIPGCFEIQDTRARCTQILVLTRSAATHCDACASVCVCPARGQRAWRQNGQEFMRADVPALTSCSLCGCTMRGMPEPVARKPQPFIAPLPPAPPRPARAKEDAPQHDSVDLAWPLCPLRRASGLPTAPTSAPPPSSGRPHLDKNRPTTDSRIYLHLLVCFCLFLGSLKNGFKTAQKNFWKFPNMYRESNVFRQCK